MIVGGLVKMTDSFTRPNEDEFLKLIPPIPILQIEHPLRQILPKRSNRPVGFLVYLRDVFVANPYFFHLGKLKVMKITRWSVAISQVMFVKIPKR